MNVYFFIYIHNIYIKKRVLGGDGRERWCDWRQWEREREIKKNSLSNMNIIYDSNNKTRPPSHSIREEGVK